jgi:hypothetical protein
LVKGNAGCLALLPPLAIALSRRWDLIRKPAFWLPIPIVLVLCGPWYAVTHGMVEAGFRWASGWEYFGLSLAMNTAFLLAAAGVPASVCAVHSLSTTLLARRAQDVPPLQITCVALVLALVLFQALVPVAIEARYVIPALPPLLILAVFGFRRLREAVVAHGRATRRPALAALTVAAIGLIAVADLGVRTHFTSPRPDVGIRAAVPAIRGAMLPVNPVVLIVSDAVGEAAAVSELLMSEPGQPQMFALRGSRILAGGGYNNTDYVTRYTTTADVMAALDALNVPLVLLRDDPYPRVRWGHVNQMEQAIRDYPARWKLIYEDTSVSPPVRLYALPEHSTIPADTARLRAVAGPRTLPK